MVHYQALTRVSGYLIYLRDTKELGLFYAPANKTLFAYSDADWSERLSTCGGCFFFCGCLVAWYSRLLRSVSHSTAEAEYQGASMAAREGIFIREVLTDLGQLPTGPTTLYLDSKSAIDMAFDPVAFKKTKHILRDAYFLRDLVARLVYAPKHVTSEEQLADMLTKAVARAIFSRLRGRLLGMPRDEQDTPRCRRG